MKVVQGSLFVLALMVPSGDSIAKPDGGAQDGGAFDAGASKLTIPPRVEEKDLPMFDAEPFPTEKSKAPTMDEWTTAPRVRITRMPLGSGCIPKRVREWVKIRCEEQTAGLRLIAGNTDGIALWLGPHNNTPYSLSAAQFFEIVFPVRQGDARVFEVLSFEFGSYSGWGTNSAYLVEEEWPVGGTPQIAMLKR
jgi:hypothetical protein